MSWYATKKASKLPALDKRKILVFDTETTGLEPTLDEILQITILDGYGSKLFDSYIRPKRHKSWKQAEKINGISYEMVKDKPSFSDVRSEIQRLFNDALLVVGYNVNFDINFVQAEGIVVSGQIFDVMTAFASYRAAVDHGFTRWCKLKECAEYFGHYYSPHDSAQDAEATLACFNSLISDPRFTTYKARERKQLKDKDDGGTLPRKTSFSIQLSTHKRHSMAFYGICLTCAAEVLLCILRNTVVVDYMEYASWMLNIQDHWNADRLGSILYILIGAGGLLTLIGIIRLILRLPRIIVAKFMHFINRFK